MVIGERYELEKDEELRIEVDLANKEENIMIELLSGIGEIFGTEMVIGTKYKFHHGAKFSVYTYHGCALTVFGLNQTRPYKSKEHPMIQYLNVHSGLEDLRCKVDKEGLEMGPITMVVGPQDVGKTTLCRLLVNYAVRQNRRPIFVDLDVAQCSISLPGTIAATLIERPASIEEGFPQNAPLVYHYGHDHPRNNSVLYKDIVSEMAKTVRDRLKADKKAGSSGAIINTFGWVRGEGYSQLKHVATAFGVDVVIVLDQERVYNDLAKDLDEIKVLWLPKSNGVVERTQDQRNEEASSSIKEYFYGSNNSLFPHSFDVKFADLKERIYKIGAPSLPDSCMPLGMKAEDNQTKLVSVGLTPKDLLNHILAVSHGTVTEGLIKTNVQGFVVVTEVNVQDGKVSILSPQPKPLPRTLLVLSDVKYIDR